MIRINVAYACNEAYMEQTTVSLVSLFENNKNIEKIVIYFIDMGITKESAAEMNRLVESYGHTLIVIPFDKIAYDINVDNTGRHIQSVYAKLFFGRIEEIDRIIYLDSDIVVNDSLMPLWNLDLGDCVCAGVETIHTIEDNRRIGLTPEERAINDGMVLMDLKAWRDGDYLLKCMEYIKCYNGNPPVLSEGTINAVCKGKILIIDPRYNLMSGIVGETSKRIECLTGRKYYSQEILDNATKNPCIIHYLSGFYNRPWCEQCSHPMKDIYLKFRKKTKWRNAPLQKKKLSRRVKLIGLAYYHLPMSIFVKLRSALGNKIDS